MNILLQLTAFIVIFLSVINLLRMSLFLIGADLYTLNNHRLKNKKLTYNFPKISVVIPAHNEEKSIIKCVSSVLKSDYEKEKLEIIVVDDGSTDATVKKLIAYKEKRKIDNLKLISQFKKGKAGALNNGMKNYATGTLVMCLDADSYIAPDAIRNVIRYFQNEKTMVVAANVKIAKSEGLLNLIQRMEYLISYQMKKAQNTYNIEYIVGGIGSTFRKSFLEIVDFYDTNTVTEDIDITMKILRHGNKYIKIGYGTDVVVYTQSVLSVKELVNQRYRWKWGRYQTFLKNSSMFFSSNHRFTKSLTYFYLPFALFCDLFYLFEPIVVLYIFYIAFHNGDPITILAAITVITFYMWMNILSDDTTDRSDKLMYILIAPFMYLLFYVLSFVEYMALIKSLIRLPKLQSSILDSDQTWKSVERTSFS